MSAPGDVLTVGAVAYDPRVVTIWERFRDYFAVAGVPTDYALYATYEQLVDALLDGTVDIGWNTNTAFVMLEQRLGTHARILGMRDIDANYASVIVTRRGESVEDPTELAGRRLAVGSRDSGHASILPLHFLRQQGLNTERDIEIVRCDADLGKHGDTTAAELEVLRAVAAGSADSGALGDATWSHFRAAGLPELELLEITWRSPTYNHCNFTAGPSLDDAIATAWQQALLAMHHDDPRWRDAMDLEAVKQWVPGDRSGYDALFAALADPATPTLAAVRGSAR